MNENQRTAVYLVVAALAVVIAVEPWGLRERLPSHQEETGKLFPDFTDALSATSMTIMKFDEETGELRPFQVTQVNGLWSIPSHQNYPADAQEHLAQAATALMDLEILGVASTAPGEHELYGVIDPDAKSLSPGTTGVGTRVTMKNAKDDVLADLIIGKDVKEQPHLRYVRKAGRDQVYKIAVRTDKLSTTFGDWIEKDLLKLNPLDLVSVRLNDYSADVAGVSRQGGIQIAQLKRSEIGLRYDDKKNALDLDKLVEYQRNKPITRKLKDNEEVNAEKLDVFKKSLSDLRIVDVERKPAGLKGLKVVEDIAQDEEALRSLFPRGFFPVGGELLSSEGEIICDMKDGVEYVLRFGQLAASSTDTGKKEGDDKQGKKDDATSRINRYLFVSAQFNPDLIPKPELQSLPGDEPTDEKKAEPKKADDKAKGDKKDQAKSADQQAAEEDEAIRKKAEEEKRGAIEKENDRKLDEYNEKVKKGEEHVKELNERFADWYYIISDDVYRKVHLSQADVVKAKEEKPGEGSGIGDLKQIQSKGLNKKK